MIFLVLDSWAKPESGILDGNLVWEGRYYECLTATDGNNLTGKYCGILITLPGALVCNLVITDSKG